MSKPLNEKRQITARIDKIETENGGALNLVNATSINFLDTYTVSGGIFSQVESKSAKGNIQTEQELLNTNNAKGAIIRYANTSTIGSTIRILAQGDFTADSGRDLTINWKLGNLLLGTTGVMGIDKNSNEEGWFLDLILVVRKLGGAGVAEISTTGNLSWMKKTGGDMEQYSLNNINKTTYETLTDKEFSITAQWSSSAKIDDDITLNNCVIQRLF